MIGVEFLVKARRMPRQPLRKERLNKQKKNKQANRLGSCRLLTKAGESPTSFEWACRCFSKTNACRLVIERQEIAISRKKCVIVRTPTPHPYVSIPRRACPRACRMACIVERRHLASPD